MSERKAIFITGGGSGIGRAVALYFAERGWFVGLGDIDKAGMRETQDMIGNGFVYSHLFDVRDRAAWDEALEAFSVATGGRIDVLFNNAGIPLGGSLMENSTEEIERCLDINLKGVLFGAQAGIYGTPGASVYSATKFGVRAITESLDGEWAEDGINVRSLMPSFIDTPLLDHNPNARTNEGIRQRVTEAGLEITPVEEVAAAAWAAVHGEKLHTTVGKTAKSMAFAARWLPGRVRKQTRESARPLGQ